jgi:hypothetical protein
MAKSGSKSTAAMERLLEERRQYEAWLARLDASGDTTPDHVRTRVRADYRARLEAVTQELKEHAAQARQLIVQKRERLTQLARKEKEIADALKESELRHSVGEYDEAEWVKVHRTAQGELISLRGEIKAAQSDIANLEELEGIVRSPGGAGRRAAPASGNNRHSQVDELAFLKSVTEDEPSAPSPRRASGATFQPVDSTMLPEPDPTVREAAMDGKKTLKCKACGTMNLATEWYCESCGSELAAV